LVEHAGSNQQEVGVIEMKIAEKVRPAEHMGGWNVEVMVVDPMLHVSSILQQGTECVRGGPGGGGGPPGLPINILDILTAGVEGPLLKCPSS
jgi:hypothetical protein